MGFPTDKVEGLKWIKLAAGQRHATALQKLANLHKSGLDDLVEQSDENAMSLMKEAADLGNRYAMVQLGAMYRTCPADMKKAAYYCTLAYQYSDGKESDPDPFPGFILGTLHFLGCGGLRKSLHLARCYFEEAANLRYVAAYRPLALTLLQLGDDIYRGMNSIPGHSYIPRALHFARKAKKHFITTGCGDPKMIKLVADLEKDRKKSCANCGRDRRLFSGGLVTCKGCLAVFYCGKECGAEHWKDGHKVDCVAQQKFFGKK